MSDVLVPAITCVNQIHEEFKKRFYTDDMMFETGCLDSFAPEIGGGYDDGTCYKFGIVNKDSKVIGYVGFCVDWYVSRVYKFGLISFDKGNPIIGKAMADVIDMIISWNIHSMEWKMVSGNPAERSYDRFCEQYNGQKLVLHDELRDRTGKYHDAIIYEVIFNQLDKT